MKKFLAFALAVAMAISPAFAKKPKLSDPFNGFNPYDVERAAVGAILIPNPSPDNGDGPYAMICSGALIGYDNEGNGLFLTARHCVWSDGDENGDGIGFIPNEFVSFHGNLDGPYYQTKIAEIAPDDDLAVLRVINVGWASEPIIPEILEREDFLVPGDPVENVSFPLDMGKLEFHGQFVAPVFPHFSRSLRNYPQWKNTMPVNITIGHGSSGSPLFDSKTHKVIGVMVGTTGEGQLMIAEPETRVVLMLLNPEKDSVSNWIGSHLPKEVQFRLPARNWDAERHPFIPGFGQI